MLQQTRVAAVIPYYERFLARFPSPTALAGAPETDLLTMWAGLGYYSRARNLQKAAQQIQELGAFPDRYEDILNLAGIGPYTAAAIASIAFDLPHAVVDGNVRRVMSRLTNNGKVDAQAIADELLDRRDPARWNQAVMELGATVCVPKTPSCENCPIAKHCRAHQAGTQNELPPKRVKRETERLEKMILIIRDSDSFLLVPGTRVAGFWDLPEPFPDARIGVKLGEFGHAITHRQYRFLVHEAKLKGRIPDKAVWRKMDSISNIPLSTIAKKALRIYKARE
jgi:A/G-specific adenine glycosylase